MFCISCGAILNEKFGRLSEMRMCNPCIHQVSHFSQFRFLLRAKDSLVGLCGINDVFVVS